LKELGCEDPAGGVIEASNRSIARFAAGLFHFKIALAPTPRR